jgi:glycosyltransferase involved in cell wall biosynthesis
VLWLKLLASTKLQTRIDETNRLVYSYFLLKTLAVLPVLKSTSNSRFVSLVVPFYNEQEALHTFFDRIRTVLGGLHDYDFEIVCVDDGSRDGTVRDLLLCAQRDPRIVVVELSRNYGKEAAITAGLEAAKGDAAVVLDADLQDPPELIPEMLSKWREGDDMVVAKREDRSSDTLFKRWTAKIFYKLHNRISKVQLPENVGDFRLLSRGVIDAVMRLPERHRFMKGLFAWVGFRVGIVTYARPERAAGQTKFSPWRLCSLALDGIYSFSTVPLRALTIVGMVCAAGTLAYLLKVIVKTWIFGIDVPGYASLIVVQLFFGSLQLIAIGVTGNYIGRIYEEVKQRPLYIVRQVHRDSTQQSRVAKTGTTKE